MHRSLSRLCFPTTILAAFFVAGNLVAADAIVVGAKVMPRSANVVLRIDRRVTVRGDDLDWPQKVTKVEGRFLGIADRSKKGWVVSDEMIPVEQAIEYYTKKIKEAKESGNRGRWLKLRGDCYLDLKMYDAAIDDYNHAIELRPGAIATYRGRIMALDGAREFDREVDECQILLSREPTSELAIFYRARGLAALGRELEAIRDFDIVLARNPKSADALEDRASCWLMLGDNNKALADVNAAIDLQPSGAGHTIRAMIHLANQCHELALADVEQGLRYEPAVDGLKMIRSALQTKLNKPDAQVDDWTQSSEMTAFERWMRAGKLLQEKEFEQALAEIDRIETNDPEWKAAKYLMRGMIHLRTEQRREALADLDKALEIKADEPEPLYLRGLCYWSVKMYPNALADLDAALERKPDFADALAARGAIKLEQREYEQALQDFNRAVELDSGRSRLDRASAYRGMHRYAEAIDDCTCALEEARGESIARDTKVTFGKREFSIDIMLVSSSSPEQKRRKQIAQALAMRSLCYWEQGDYGHATADFWQSMQVDLKETPTDRPDRQAAKP